MAGASHPSSSFVHPSSIGCTRHVHCRYHSLAAGSRVLQRVAMSNREWSPFSSHGSLPASPGTAGSCGCKAAVGTVADSSEQKSLAEHTGHQQRCVMYHVTLRLFSVTQEDLEVQRDESGSDKAV